LYSILQANAGLCSFIPARFLALKILDTASASSLFVTLLGALLVRQQFVIGLRPRIGYKTMHTIKQFSSEAKDTCSIWQVRIRNSGQGTAIVNGCEFKLEIYPAKSSSCGLVFRELISEMGKSGLLRGQDYWLENITSGFTLSPKEDCIVFEIKTEHIQKVKRLDMLLHFQGLLGDKYYRKIFFIPRGG
jgi:hypothetical protein